MSDNASPTFEWRLARLADYWDQRLGAIDRYSRILEGLPQEQLSLELAAIENAVTGHAKLLNDGQLALAAVIMADDLYKNVSVLSRWDPSIGSYLKASAGCLLKLLSGRGIILQYVVDNQFEASLTGMAGPLEWYDVWFPSAGFVYICPQCAAKSLMDAHRHPADKYIELLPTYIDEGRMLAREIVQRCHSDHRPYFFLDADSRPGSFDVAMRQHGHEGIIGVFRNDAPVPGSRIDIVWPPSLRGEAERIRAQTGQSLQQDG